jgi:hypothetical protein
MLGVDAAGREVLVWRGLTFYAPLWLGVLYHLVVFVRLHVRVMT